MSVKTIEEAVAGRFAKLGGEVADAAINILVEKELDKRKVQVVSAFSEYDELQKRLRRLDKGDVLSYNGDGSVATQAFSKQRLDELKKVRERMAKLEKALEDAIANSDFKKLNELGNAPKFSDKGNTEEGAEGSSE
jgi:hypothetical protein